MKDGGETADELHVCSAEWGHQNSVPHSSKQTGCGSWCFQKMGELQNMSLYPAPFRIPLHTQIEPHCNPLILMLDEFVTCAACSRGQKRLPSALVSRTWHLPYENPDDMAPRLNLRISTVPPCLQDPELQYALSIHSLAATKWQVHEHVSSCIETPSMNRNFSAISTGSSTCIRFTYQTLESPLYPFNCCH